MGIAPNVRRFMTFAAAKRIGAVLAKRSVLAEREQEPWQKQMCPKGQAAERRSIKRLLGEVWADVQLITLSS